MRASTRAFEGLFCLLLACAVVWCLMRPAASAADKSITAEVAIATGIQEKPEAEVEAQWDDAWFAGDAGEYRQELAMTAMTLSAAAYAETEEGVSVQDALEAFGFDGVKSYNYQPSAASRGRTAYTLGLKTVKDGDGKDVKLAAVVIRGTGTYTEWAGNLDVGSGSDHEGFAQARNELLKKLESYLTQAGIDTASGGVKFFITGHSRGGAVANLTAARLAEDWEKENIYAYTFASPSVSADAEEEGYENIFNIIREDDLVTQVPLADWGYGRYGVDVPLPNKDSEDYEEIFAGMEETYKSLTGQDYAAYKDPEAVEEMKEALRQLLPDTKGVNMKIVSALLSGDLEALTKLVDGNRAAALLMSRMTVELSEQVMPLVQQERSGLTSAHCMAGYYSWLTAAAEDAE